MAKTFVVSPLADGMWGFLVLVSLDAFLYPQYDGDIVKPLFERKGLLQEAAKMLLESGGGAKEVRERWQAVADGTFFEPDYIQKVLLGRFANRSQVYDREEWLNEAKNLD